MGILTHQSHISKLFRRHPHSQSQVSRRYLHSPESHQSSLLYVSSITRVTSVKSLECILTYQSHISQVFFRYHHSPGSHQSSLEKVSSLTRVTSVKSSLVILYHQSNISQVSRRHPHLPESHQ